MEIFVAIRDGRWEAHHGSQIQRFPESGRGLKSFFKKHRVRSVLCSSSVDCPQEESKLTSGEASSILNQALSW